MHYGKEAIYNSPYGGGANQFEQVFIGREPCYAAESYSGTATPGCPYAPYTGFLKRLCIVHRCAIYPIDYHKKAFFGALFCAISCVYQKKYYLCPKSLKFEYTIFKMVSLM